MLVKSIGWTITPYYADKLYGKRFGIETGYRDKHKYQIFTCTKILSTRHMFFFDGNSGLELLAILSHMG
ncbi:MAG: hypothetical protein BAJALOKI1v1_1380012 [Promethearchaeota archaeon]|nr:MAG: hypothetical protein BAJALOKI1v1_1380012 [Candidatus Lokiarchaeota archaeon]